MRENLSKVHEIEKDFCVLLLSLPSRGGWIEIPVVVGLGWVSSSLPSRGGWIEIGLRCLEFHGRACGVPPLTGRVD